MFSDGDAGGGSRTGVVNDVQRVLALYETKVFYKASVSRHRPSTLPGASRQEIVLLHLGRKFLQLGIKPTFARICVQFSQTHFRMFPQRAPQPGEGQSFAEIERAKLHHFVRLASHGKKRRVRSAVAKGLPRHCLEVGWCRWKAAP